jgi:hypothetical protein
MPLIRPEDEAARQAELASRRVDANRQDLRHFVELDQVDWPRLANVLVESFRSSYRVANPDERYAREWLAYRRPVSEAHRAAAEVLVQEALCEVVGDDNFELDVAADRNTLLITLAAKKPKKQ